MSSQMTLACATSMPSMVGSSLRPLHALLYWIA
jgi:hypothetical protein